MKVFLAPHKMDELKPIIHKEFNEFINDNGFKGRNNYMLKDLKAKFGFKPLVERGALVVSSNDMESTEFLSIREAAKAIGVGERAWEKGSLGIQGTMGEISRRKLRAEALRCFS